MINDIGRDIVDVSRIERSQNNSRFSEPEGEQIHLGISHEKQRALAFAVIE